MRRSSMKTRSMDQGWEPGLRAEVEVAVRRLRVRQGRRTETPQGWKLPVRAEGDVRGEAWMP
jgi:hypothetical protein